MSHPETKIPLPIAGTIALAFIAFAVILTYKNSSSINIAKPSSTQTQTTDGSAVATEPVSSYEESVTPSAGVVIPVKWGDLGKQMIDAGVIDQAKFESIYSDRGGLDEQSKKMLTGNVDGQITINSENAGAILNMLWALGLANKNDVLDKGPMMDPQYGGAGGFASTGGWTVAKGDAMDYYSKSNLIKLTLDQQKLVEDVTKNIYRPCCGNSTYFPDCNHGMAMLGLMELMASQGATEEQMYKTALAVNSYWFPSTYVTIAKLKAGEGVSWDKVDAKEVLGNDFSSAGGYRKVLEKVSPEAVKGGGSCGV